MDNIISILNYCPGIVRWVEREHIVYDQISSIGIIAKTRQRDPILDEGEDPTWIYHELTGNYTVTLIMKDYYHKQKLFNRGELFGR